jgi:hypothetical protein
LEASRLASLIDEAWREFGRFCDFVAKDEKAHRFLCA